MSKLEKPQPKTTFDKAVALGAKLIRWGLYVFVGLVVLGLLIWGVVAAYTYQTETRHENNVVVVVKVSDTCLEEFPIAVGIMNNSGRTIESIRIYPKAHREGYSKDLSSSASIETDKIIAPGERHAFCWRGELDFLVGKTYKPAELIWEPGTYYIEFE